VLGPQSYHKLPEMIAKVSREFGERLETNESWGLGRANPASR